MRELDHITIRKDGFTPSRPWVADVHFDDGTMWKSWSYGFRTKTALMQHIEAVRSDAKVVRA